MKRKKFIQLTGLSILSMPIIKSISSLEKLSASLSNTSKMPVFFIGHGSPMNGIEENEFVQGFKTQSASLQKPNAILVVSAHWETKGTFVTAMENPRTIHDFGGFPEALYQVEYPAPGMPQLAQDLAELAVPKGTIQLDYQWGLDHGTWTVIKHFYPQANVPVLQLSLDRTIPANKHYELAKQLSQLRNKGVLIVGSGNMVHNLRHVSFKHMNQHYGYDWALEANNQLKTWIQEQNLNALTDLNKHNTALKLAIPTPEHYLPLLYALALKENNESISFFNDHAIGGSLTMTSLRIG